MARPSLYTPEARAAIVEAVAKGHSRDAAAGAAGIHPRTLYHWIAAGRRGEEPYRQLLQDLEKAEAKAEHDIIDKIREAGQQGPWQALAWLAERKWPAKYAQRAMVLIQVKSELDAFWQRVIEKGCGHLLAEILDRIGDDHMLPPGEDVEDVAYTELPAESE